MKRAYQFFLLLYPREYRDQFAEEMTRVLEETSAERCAQGWASYTCFALAEMIGLIVGAAVAWFGRKPSTEAPLASSQSSALPQEVIEAQQRVDLSITGMVRAIANHQFTKARWHSDQERQARENLRLLCDKYGISD